MRRSQSRCGISRWSARIAIVSAALSITACQSDADNTGTDACTGLSEDLVSYVVGGKDFTTTENGPFPYRPSDQVEAWGCEVEVDGEVVFHAFGAAYGDPTPPTPVSSSDYFTFRGGTGYIESREGTWVCGSIDMNARSTRGPVSESQMGAVMLALAHETGCRVEPDSEE